MDDTSLGGAGPGELGSGGAAPDAGVRCPDCVVRGAACGNGGKPCCDDVPCLPFQGGGLTQGKFCGGIPADATEASCAPEGAGCRWVETTLCAPGGSIAAFCGPGARALQLRRCDGGCLVPDELYAGFFLRGCGSSTATACPEGSCAAGEFAAALCCDE